MLNSKRSLYKCWIACIAGLVIMIMVFAFVGLRPELSDFERNWATGYGILLMAMFAYGVIRYPMLIRSLNREAG